MPGPTTTAGVPLPGPPLRDGRISRRGPRYRPFNARARPEDRAREESAGGGGERRRRRARARDPPAGAGAARAPPAPGGADLRDGEPRPDRPRLGERSPRSLSHAKNAQQQKEKNPFWVGDAFIHKKGKGNQHGNSPLVIFHVLGVCYMFLALMIVCDNFFGPALDCMVEKWEIDDDTKHQKKHHPRSLLPLVKLPLPRHHRGSIGYYSLLWQALARRGRLLRPLARRTRDCAPVSIAERCVRIANRAHRSRALARNRSRDRHAHASETMSDFGPAVPPNFKHRAAASSAPKKVTNTDSDLRGFEASVLQAATPPRQMAGNATGTKVKAATEVREMPEPGPPLGTLPAGTDVVVVMRMGPAVQIAMPICGFIDTAALDE